MNFFHRIFGSKPANPVKPGFDASVAQRLAAAGKDPNRVAATPAELLTMPERPALEGFKGMVRLELTLDETGQVVSVEMDGAPFQHISALESWAHLWAFSPARMEGQAHPCRMVFEVTWT
ncbi:MAG: hypothetical protein KGN80_03595 [Acidobacteriota bacterium]|nr:hypothetical protein [Acidobacteriota bacterium]